MGHLRVQCVVVRQWQTYLRAVRVVKVDEKEKVKPKPVLHLYDSRAETTVCRRTYNGVKPVCCLITDCAEPEHLEGLSQCKSCMDIAGREKCARGLSLERRRRFGEAVSHFNELADQQTAFAEIAGAIQRFPPRN